MLTGYTRNDLAAVGFEGKSNQKYKLPSVLGIMWPMLHDEY